MWPQVKAVLFDMDGTLIDSEHIHYNSLIDVCRRYGYDFTAGDETRFLGTSMRYIYDNIHKDFIKSISFEQFRGDNIEYFEKVIGEQHLFTAVKESLDYLKGKKIPLCLVTNSEEQATDIALRKTKIRDYFDYVVTSANVKNAKPFPEPYLLAAQHLNMDIKDCLVVEDSPTGVEAGLKAGAHVVAITSSIKAENLKKAHKIVEKFSEIPFKKLF